MHEKQNPVREHIFISGRVQGVAFRYYAQKVALKIGVTGWIRNCEDGKVEAIIEGSRENVESFIDWCRIGPRSANVEKLMVYPEEYRGEFIFFNIRV